MKLTKQMLFNGHCEYATVTRGDLEYSHQLYIEHGAYFIRLIIREDGDVIVNRSYVERVTDTTFKDMLTLYRQSVAWSGMCLLYSFKHKGLGRFDVFSSGIDQARVAISNMYGMYTGSLESLIE